MGLSMMPWRRPGLGPALWKAPLPIASIAISAVVHTIVLTAFVLLSGVLSQWTSSKVYVVNLVPAVASVGASSRALPPRPSSPPLSTRAPERVTEEPASKAQLPEAALPQPRPPSRPPALPGLRGKELPALASDRTERRQPPPRPEPPASAAEPRPAPLAPIPLGRPGGSPAGTASLTLDVSDFPFTYYLRQIQQKVSEKWVPPRPASEPGRRVVVLFEIGRNGQVRSSKVERSSGNVLYDQSALRAVVEATPFPPLPQEFPAQSLRVHFGFEFQSDRG
jgi:protein TonB